MRNDIPLVFSRSFVLVAIACLAASTLQGAVLVNYSFSGTAAPTTEAPNINAGDAAWVGLINSGFSGGGTAFVRADSVAASFDSGEYFEFTITADAGYALNLDNLTFIMGGTNQSGISTYTVNANVRSNVDLFAANLTVNPGAVPTASYTVATSSTSYSTFTVDLSGSQFDDLSAITLRLYPTDSSASNTNFYRYDSMTLNGDVAAVPEPSAIALLAIGLMSILSRARSRRALTLSES